MVKFPYFERQAPAGQLVTYFLAGCKELEAEHLAWFVENNVDMVVETTKDNSMLVFEDHADAAAFVLRFPDAAELHPWAS